MNAHEEIEYCEGAEFTCHDCRTIDWFDVGSYLATATGWLLLGVVIGLLLWR